MSIFFQILLIFLQRMELLLKLTPAKDVQDHVLPMLYRGLDSDTPQIHELCLSVLPTFAGLLDHANVKNSLLPRIKRLCLSTSGLSVRVNCLLCIGRLLEHLDKWLVLDEVLPFLPQIPSREPAVLMGILGIYKLALNHKKLGISKEIIATRILPFLMPLCIENGLTLAQFNALVSLCKQMFQLVETEHRTKLEQLNSVHEQQKVLESSLPAVTATQKPIDSAFSGLGLDSYVNSLSLEDKQRISQQQDIAKLMHNQPALEPKSIVQSNSFSQSKDLTASLLDSNVNQLASNFNFSTNKLPAPPSHSPMQQRNQLPNFSQPSPLSGMQNTTGSSSLNQNFNQWSSNSNTWQSQNQNFGQNFMSSQVQHSYGQQSNWTALDNLLPGTSATTKTPMNQMIPQKQPLIPANNSSNNNMLSSDDIMDLLS